jgi:triosephosphate isomerase
MEKLIVANWKANLSLPQAEKWLAGFSAGYRPHDNIRVVLAVPFPFLYPLREQLDNLSGVSWAAQDVSPYPPGSYTGAVPAAWMKGQVDYALIGHRERRRYFHESIQDVSNKASEALAEDIGPILCVEKEMSRQQAAAIEPDDLERLIVAYTPADAEQLEIARNIAGVTDAIQYVSGIFPGCPVLYGGGVNAGNAAELLKIPQVAGVMAAGGCHDPRSFVELLDNGSEAI